MSQRETVKLRCYQCMNLVAYLFADCRCIDCTRVTEDEVSP